MFINKIVSKGVMYGYVRLEVTDIKDTTKDKNWSAWTIFVQSSQNHEMSDYVDRVTFCLHETFTDNVRTVYHPPYETTVLGTEACNAYAYIYFKDPVIQPQMLQIYIQFSATLWYEKQVRYDNLIFVRPNAVFYQKLQIVRPATKLSGVLHHIQPDLFKQLYPKAKMVDYKPQMKKEDFKQMCESVDGGDGCGVYLMEPVRAEKSAERILEGK